jgi:transcriptional regulator with AbiEi antitoxin domain of type IV toxin-antitoxin system
MQKINQLIKHWPRGTVAIQAWLEKQGVYRQLANRYCASGWLDRIGSSAYILSGDKVSWEGALYALQAEADMQINVAALTALELQGSAHFIPMNENHPVWLFKNNDQKNIPAWFKQSFTTKHSLKIVNRHLFDGDWRLGLIEQNMGEYKILISSRERAIFEYFDLVPAQQSFEHGVLLMELLQTLRPVLIQELLEKCTSIKVKRLFMNVAEMQNHEWVKNLDLSKIDFGSGNRVIKKGGKLFKKYGLLLPVVNSDENEDDNQP